jgi:RNA exonuclease 4
MVGVTTRDVSVLARVSIVDFHGTQIYDAYVQPLATVTNWRTEVSGIRPSDMKQAQPLHIVQEHVRELFKDRIIVGHALNHDMRVLAVTVPPHRRRDTAHHQGYRKLNDGATPSLKFLADRVLGIEIQTGEHDSIVDARTAMLLYKHAKKEMDEGHRLIRKPVSTGKKEAPDTPEALRATKRAKRLKKRKKKKS